ncbi:MAG: TraM recognition domain-containing protein [Nitrospinota bacterium]|nr:TraM recognition domain-containing protein [Nitrospinota bacterium]
MFGLFTPKPPIELTPIEGKTILGRGYSLDDPTKKRIPVLLPDEDRKRHMWVFGTTGVGKTRVMENMIEQDIRKGYSVAVFDPKGDIELFSKIAQVAFEEGREEDLMLVTPIFPELSARIDPLRYFATPEELAGHIVSGVTVGREPYFSNVAYDLSLSIVQALVLLSKYSGEDPDFNLDEVKKYITHNGLENLKSQVQVIDTPDLIKQARDIIQDIDRILENEKDYFNKISNSLAVALRELTTGNIGAVIGKADMNRFVERLEQNKPVILVVQPGSLLMRRAAYTAGKVLVSMIQAMVGRKYASGKKLSPSLCIYLDEAQSLIYPGIDEMFSKAGSANVSVHGFCQSLSQLYAAIGKDYSKSIMDNTNTRIFMRVPDLDTATYIADHFGDKTVWSPFLSLDGSGSVSARDDKIPVIEASEITKLNPRVAYMFTYSGRWKLRTADVSELWLDVIFPELKTRLESEGEE